VRVNLGHLRRRGPFEENHRPVGTSRERCRLGKESSIRKRSREIRARLSFNDDTDINEVVTDGKTFHANVEVSASACEISTMRRFAQKSRREAAIASATFAATQLSPL
jgi:hypothetical protein